MPNQEKAKRKSRPSRTRLFILISIALILIPVTLCTGFFWTLPPSSEVPLIGVLNTNEAIHTYLLMQVPLGTSRSDVESYIAETLQPSRNTCSDDSSNICLQIMGHPIVCRYWIWEIQFHFEEEQLQGIEVSQYGACL